MQFSKGTPSSGKSIPFQLRDQPCSGVKDALSNQVGENSPHQVYIPALPNRLFEDEDAATPVWRNGGHSAYRLCFQGDLALKCRFSLLMPPGTEIEQA